MNHRLFILATSLLLPGLLFSCQKEEELQPPIEQIIPLQVGNEWQYREYLYNRDGSLTDSMGIYTRSVLRDTVINKSTWYILNDRSIVQNARQGYAYYNAASNQGLLVYQGGDMGGVGYNYVYPTYNLWVYTVPTHDRKPIPHSRQMLSGNLYQVEYQYNYSSPASVQTQKREEWVVPNIGVARADVYYRNTTQLQRRRELISYKLK
ncbi:hypothetical protein SAMN06265337_2898 [Hymenobacter gelipurpurascens]|uniref:Uncharacterized protein n=1 Tax=Hymenobacter gelipurpurascens TaxID=89968 RepID=A0A212UB59_9BACT|nr:hypothetical protein [Hymenobacter gelipurpurascens]SNC75485.1 hypothetical protein SAMN06265337_2898 [Hymenobacter gelipurpurascens]